MSLKIYEKKWLRGMRQKEPKAIFNKSQPNRIQFNWAAMLLLGDCKYFVFLWDEEINRIAIKAARKDDPNSYKLSGGDRQGYLSAGGFLRFIGYVADENRRFDIRADGDFFVIDLTEGKNHESEN